MARDDEIIEVDGLTLIHESADAYKVTDGRVTCWLPKSKAKQIDDDTFSMPEWMGFEKGLI